MHSGLQKLLQVFPRSRSRNNKQPLLDQPFDLPRTNSQRTFRLSRRCIIRTHVPNGLPTEGRRTLARTSDRSELYELLLVTYFGTQEVFLLVLITQTVHLRWISRLFLLPKYPVRATATHPVPIFSTKP